MDVLAIYDAGWFGQSSPQDVEELPAQLSAAPAHQRRASAGRFSDLAAAAEQGQAGASPARDRRRQAPTSSAAQQQQQQQQQQQAPQLVRHSGNGRLHQNGLAAGEEDGVLGTWAGRQRIFSELLRGQERQAGAAASLQAGGQQQQQQQQQGRAEQQEQAEQLRYQLTQPPLREEDEEGSPAAVVLRPPEPSRAAPAARGQQSAQPAAESIDLDQEMNAAWRWRFTRKWQAEQMKQFDAPAAAPGGDGEDEEEWTAALRMMQAVDGGLNMQIGRTLSLHNSSIVDAGSSMGMDQSLTLMSPGLSQYMLLDSSIKESPLREAGADATSAIVSLARKAQHLRRQQQEIERQVNERWEATSGGAQWVAQHLPAVQIDSWSAFPFVLVRLSEPQRSQRQKLLVRGRNGATEHQAYAAAEQEAARATIAHRLPGPRVELVASGRMEWVAAAGERRTLRIRVTRLLPPAAKDSRMHGTAGAAAVVAEVTRSSFPQGGFDIVAVGDREQEVRVGGPAPAIAAANGAARSSRQ
ncbi:hypothetical protein ABPG75_013026 [Micractinium tetrahymenae]